MTDEQLLQKILERFEGPVNPQITDAITQTFRIIADDDDLVEEMYQRNKYWYDE